MKLVCNHRKSRTTMIQNRSRYTTAVAALIFSLLGGLTVSSSTFAADRPNILFILVDDQSPFDLKIYNGKSELQTPNLDRLAARGNGL